MPPIEVEPLEHPFLTEFQAMADWNRRNPGSPPYQAITVSRVHGMLHVWQPDLPHDGAVCGVTLYPDFAGDPEDARLFCARCQRFIERRLLA